MRGCIAATGVLYPLMARLGADARALSVEGWASNRRPWLTPEHSPSTRPSETNKSGTDHNPSRATQWQPTVLIGLNFSIWFLADVTAPVLQYCLSTGTWYADTSPSHILHANDEERHHYRGKFCQRNCCPNHWQTETTQEPISSSSKQLFRMFGPELINWLIQ